MQRGKARTDRQTVTPLLAPHRREEDQLARGPTEDHEAREVTQETQVPAATEAHQAHLVHLARQETPGHQAHRAQVTPPQAAERQTQEDPESERALTSKKKSALPISRNSTALLKPSMRG